MALSGTTTFNLDIQQMIEEAYERCGVESRSGYDMRTARRSLNILLMEWANRGFNMWAIEERTLALTYNVGSYTLDADIVDVIEQVVQIPPTTSGVNVARLNMSRVSVSTHATRTNPNIQGRPVEVWYDRAQAAPVAHIWPLPDSSGSYTLIYYVMRRFDDAGVYSNDADVPFRFLPALVAGLAYHLARKKLVGQDSSQYASFSEQRIARLQQEYEQTFQAAADEDREKAPLMITPRGDAYRIN